MKVVIATGNRGKVKEFKEILEPLGFEPVSMADEGITADITEDGETFEENAHIKAKAVYDICHLPVIADDSGLEVEFLGGAPGIYSARYGGENATDVERYEKVLSELEGVDDELRGARFVCAIYFILSDEKQYCVTGTLDGYIGHAPQGENGFGYDPIFMVDKDRSVAELSDDEKNEISHRGRALRNLLEALRENKEII